LSNIFGKNFPGSHNIETGYFKSAVELFSLNCMHVQKTVTRLPAPHGTCQDPDSLDSTKNAYADFYPVKYTPSVRLLYRLFHYLHVFYS